MRGLILTAILVVITTPALAQGDITYTISPRNGSTQHVQGSDGSNYDYSYGQDGSIAIQKDGATGTYQGRINPDGSGAIQGVDQPNWTPPAQ